MMLPTLGGPGWAYIEILENEWKLLSRVQVQLQGLGI